MQDVRGRPDRRGTLAVFGVPPLTAEEIQAQGEMVSYARLRS